ncbi:MAG: TlpA family protein disulfide reductase [Kangiellaceae bacterium]|nr:TlpA family protein disulfide reductase [Kangiellaceae bacterium]MCW9000416.1 TlpA family protein disulfide reductase [Kangiellaceae bacterium]
MSRLIIVLWLFLCLFLYQSSAPIVNAATVDDLPSLPRFQLEKLDGSGTFESSKLVGKLVYLDYWASWCSPCLESMPFLQSLSESYPEKSFKIVAINIDKDRDKATDFLSKLNITYLNLYDPDGVLGKTLDVTKMPTAFLISPDGKILIKHTGFNQDYAERLKSSIDKQLKTKQQGMQRK